MIFGQALPVSPTTALAIVPFADVTSNITPLTQSSAQLPSGNLEAASSNFNVNDIILVCTPLVNLPLKPN